ncbi:MAG TPA: circadian clock KaiB family protein [bacterium]|nr:circadian clock KaiB family protein [bacterium]
MTPAKKPPAKGGGSRNGQFKFILFVAGREPNSVLARQNLQRLCQERLPGRHTIEIIDVFQDLDAALKHNILITPTLIKVAPEPLVTIFGNLSDSSKLMASLQLTE